MARLQENPRLLDNVFDSRNFRENPEEITLEGFFRFHSEEDLLATTEGIITQLNTLNYEMISRKQDYLDQSQQVRLKLQYIKFKEIYKQQLAKLEHIISKNQLLSCIEQDPHSQVRYEETYFDYISVDSGLIRNKFKMIETVNIMKIDENETDSQILKYIKESQDQVQRLSRNTSSSASTSASRCCCATSSSPSPSSRARSSTTCPRTSSGCSKRSSSSSRRTPRPTPTASPSR